MYFFLQTKWLIDLSRWLIQLISNLSININGLNLFSFAKNSVGISVFLLKTIVLLQALVHKKGTNDGFVYHPPTQIICRYNN